MTVLSPQGLPISERYNVTNEPEPNWHQITPSHVHDFPALAATLDGRYITCWTKPSAFRVSCQVLAFNGAVISPVGLRIDLQATGADTQPLDVSMTPLANNRVLVAYSESSEAGTEIVVYYILNSDGTIHRSRTVVPGSSGGQPRAIQFVSNGNVMLVWVHSDGRLGYTYLNSSFDILSGYPRYLNKVNLRAASSPSMTLDQAGRAVVTWIDGDDSDALFYALLDQDASVITPPIVFISDPLGDPEYSTSDYGFGNATYLGVYQMFTPIVHGR
jgi:hypothetical protein